MRKHGRIRDQSALKTHLCAHLPKVNATVPVTVEPYPAPGQLMNLAQEKYPHMDFERKAAVDMRTFVVSKRACERAIAMEATVPNTDLGNVLAFRLEARVYVGDSDMIEHFDTECSTHGRWRSAKSEKGLKKIVRAALLEEFRPKRPVYTQDGKMVLTAYGPTPDCLKTQAIRNAATDEVTIILKCDPERPLDDSESTRRLLMDKDGMVYNFETRRLQPNCPSMRLQRGVPFSFRTEWKVAAEAMAALDRLLDKVFEYWLCGNGPENKSLYDNPVGVALAKAFLDLVQRTQGFDYWQTVLAIYKAEGDAAPDLDEALWDTLHFAADACSWEKRCEWRYKWGDGGSGKDVSHIIEMNFFGTRDKNGTAGLIPSSFFTSTYNVNPDAPSTTLDQMRCMRYLANNEVPAHKYFNCDAVKALSEQEGVHILSRGLYASPVPWRPMAGIQCCSNHPLVLNDEQQSDTGNRRRLCYLKMKAALANSGKDVKALINKGKLNAELWWLARKFYEYLIRRPHSTRLHPIPPRVRAETEELLEQKQACDVRSWLEENTDPAPQIAQGTLATALRKKVSDTFGVDEKVADSLLKTAGAKSKRVGAGIFMTYLYPDATQHKAIRVKP